MDSLEIVISFTDQLNEAAVRSGDKTKLFKSTADYPDMEVLIEKIHRVENQLQVCLLYNMIIYRMN